MAIPNETLQKLLEEIEQKAAISQQQIAVVKAQIAAKQRERRMLQLTSTEVTSLPAETRVYEGVGRAFIMTPMADVQKRLAAESGKVASDVSNLEKKLHYLDTTAKNSKQHIDQLLQSGSR